MRTFIKILIAFAVFTAGSGLSMARTLPKMTGPPQIASDGTQWWRIPGGLLQQKNKDWTIHTFDQGLPADTVYAFAVGSDDRLWCTHGDRGVSVFDGVRWKHFDRDDFGFMGPVRAVKKTSDGTLWFGTHRDDLVASELAMGLLRYKDGQWLRFTHLTDKPIHHVHDIGLVDGGLRLADAKGQMRTFSFDASSLLQVTGRAVHPVTNVGVANLPVRLVGDDGLIRAATTTDREGRFVMQVLPGEYVLSASNGVAWSQEMTVVLDKAQANDPVDLTFPFQGEIVVTVVDSADAPVRGVMVLVTTTIKDGSVAADRHLPTDAAGQVRFWSNINADTDLEVFGAGYAPATRADVPIDSLLVGMVASPRIVLIPGRIVRGYVVADNRPVAGATITVWQKDMARYMQMEEFGAPLPAWWSYRKEVLTDKLGAFAMGGLPHREVELMITQGDYIEQKITVSPEEAEHLQIVSLNRGIILAGTVTGFDRPLNEMRVMAYPMDRDEARVMRPEAVVPDGDGRFELKKLKPGKHMVSLTTRLPYGDRGSIEIPFCSEEVDLVAGSNTVTLKPLGQGVIRGRTLLEGQPLANTLVSAYTKIEGQTRYVGVAATDSNGTYELTQLPGARIFLSFNKPTMEGPRRRIGAQDSLDLTNQKLVEHDVALNEETQKTLPIGQPAPAFVNTLLDGKKFALSDLKGRVVVLDFWATWCAPCVEEIPNVKRVYKKYKTQGLEIVGISLDQSRKALEDFVKKEKLDYLQIYNDKGTQRKIAEAYGVWGIPSVFLIDEKGILRATGLRGDKLEEEVRKALNEKKKGDSQAKL